MKIILQHIVLVLIFILFHTLSFGQMAIGYWDFPNNPDDNLADVFSPLNSGKQITCNATGTVNYSNAGNLTNCASDTGWQAGSTIKYWMIDLNTTGFTNIFVSSVLRSSPDGPRDFQLQYKAGAAGLWTPLPGATTITVADDFISGTVVSIQLPAVCENKTLLKLRWIMNSNTSVSGGAVLGSGVSYIDDIYVQANFLGHFRSVQSGNWNLPATWQASSDSLNWFATTFVPNNFSNSIVIQSGHTVNVNSKVKADEVFVNSGATLNYLGDKLTIADGPGCDLNVWGTFVDNTDTVCLFETGATWQLGAAATYIKSGQASAVTWQMNYYTGIQNIPATATWILRKNSTLINPPLSTSSGSPTGSYYPNLIIENNSPTKWNTTGIPTSSFNGPTYYPTIKGNFDVGGNGTTGLIFYNQHFGIMPTRVLGNLIVRAASSILNDGTGIEVQGNVTVPGSIYYTKTKTPKFNFTGSNAQTVSGPGSIGIYDMTLAKPSGNVTLNIPLLVDHNITFNGGKLITSNANILTVDTPATATVLNTNSYVFGPARKLGTAAFTFPVGKSRYQPLGLSSGGSYEIFWNETFGAACASGCDANNYTTANGTWLVSDLAAPGANANKFFISYSENGAAAGQCSTPGIGNATLHIGKPAMSGCPTGDCGSSYYFGASPSATSNKRAESPFINCTGKKGIQLSFEYFEGGSSTNDDAILYYFDGTAWSILTNLAKTATTCGSNLGYWTSFSISLPVSSYNNPNVKIGFNWKNNNDGSGGLTSFAVDNIRISEPLSLTTEYFDIDPKTAIGNSLEPTMDDITTCGYWNVNRDAGSTSKLISLSYDNTSCYITLPSFMRVTRFDTNGGADIWRDMGNGGFTGASAGMISAANATSDFGPFTIGYIVNPLPVELVSFNAAAGSNVVDLKWQTASEQGLDYFTIEKSLDLNTIYECGTFDKSGSDNSGFSYSAVDRFPFQGISYYRLRMTDLSGEINYSGWKQVKFDAEVNQLNCSQEINSNQLNFSISGLQNVLFILNLTDASGRLILKHSGTLNLYNQVTTQKLSPGIYSVNVYAADKIFTSKIFVK